jgi:diguanylate cyclase (GGDEF)-like protein/PAS domain S-box-containing protein
MTAEVSRRQNHVQNNEASAREQALLIAAIREYAIVRMDSRGIVQTWNAGAQRIYGYPPEEILGRQADVLCVADDIATGTPAARLADARAAGSLTHESWRCRRGGARFWAHVVLTAVHDEDGAFLGFGEIVRDNTDSRRFQSELMRRALHDSLTGLPNRALMFDRLRKALERAGRNKTCVAVFFVDLNEFKTVNDRFGHHSGDGVLIATAGRLVAAVRAQDTVARLGGDEFVVVCEGLEDVGAARAITDRLSEALSEPFPCAGSAIVVGASVGVTVASGGEHVPEHLLADADAAMYQAKCEDSGRPVRLVLHDRSTTMG